MNNLADELRQAADRVAGLGDCSAAFDALSENDVLTGQQALAAARRLLDVFAAWMAGTVARRSRPELGPEGLAARRGFASPEAMIQHVNGSSRGEAVKLVASGTLIAETDAAERAATLAATERAADPSLEVPNDAGLAGELSVDELATIPWQAAIVHAVASGTLSVDQADALRRGLGDIDSAVSAPILREALTTLVPEITGLNVELVFRRARRLRDHLDEAGIRAREKQARDDTKFTLFRRHDGMVVLNGLLAPEQGEYWLSAYDCLTSPRRGGVRFVDKEQAAWAEAIKNDPRTVHQIAADSFTALLKAGTDADPSKMYGGRYPAVRVMVTHADLEKANLDLAGCATTGAGRAGVGNASPKVWEPPARVGHGFVEGNLSPISLNTVQQFLCNTGQLRMFVNEEGHPLKLGRTQRFFSEAQRVAMSLRDGGCLFPGCDMPASRSEAHHVDHWVRDGGATDIDSGILLCAHCHRRLHHEGWQAIADRGRFWLQPPATIDPLQSLILLPSKNPLVLEMQH